MDEKKPERIVTTLKVYDATIGVKTVFYPEVIFKAEVKEDGKVSR